MATRRDVTDHAGVRAMQDLAGRIWFTGTSWHIGDLAWGRYQHIGREPEWRISLWEVGGQAVAWAWVRLPGHLDLCVDPAHANLGPEIIAWFEQVATATELCGYAMATEMHLTRAFEGAGYVAVEDPDYLIQYVRDLVELPEPVVPDGFRVRALRGDDPDDVARRVAVHRSGFHPSRVTIDSYTNVMAAWPYRVDLDWVVEAPGGELAASCLIWWDEVNKVGELEPVSTHADFRRLGLAKAACQGALRALRDLGAETAVVCSHEGPGYEAPRALYPGLGFIDVTRTKKFTRHAA